MVGDLTRRHRKAAQRDPRQVEIDEIPDALDGPDLHERRQAGLEPLGLELRLRGEHEPRGLHEIAVGDGGDPQPVGARLQLDRDRAALQHHRHRAPDVGDDGPERSGEIVVTIDGIRDGPAAVAGERGELARELEARRVHGFRVQRCGRRQVGEEGLESIDGLQPQELGDLGDAARPGLGHLCGQRVTALVQETVDVAQLAGQRRRGGDVQQRRDVPGVEQDAVVGPALDDAGDAETGVGGADVRFLEEPQAQPADLDERGPVERRVAVLDLELSGNVAGQAVGAGAAEVGFVDARPAQRERQDHERVAQRRRHVHGRRKRIAGRTVERRSVRQHAARGPEPQLAELQERLVDGQLEEPPGVGAHRAGPQLDLSVDVTVVLLEMLGLEERPLGPDDAIVPGHGWLTFT